jgi:hypothetical protein
VATESLETEAAEIPGEADSPEALGMDVSLMNLEGDLE